MIMHRLVGVSLFITELYHPPRSNIYAVRGKVAWLEAGKDLRLENHSDLPRELLSEG